jgi:hypothetical protein
VIDRILAKAISRKLLVWLVSTVFLALGFIAAGDWLVLSAIYVGVQGAADLLEVRARIPNAVKRYFQDSDLPDDDAAEAAYDQGLRDGSAE